MYYRVLIVFILSFTGGLRCGVVSGPAAAPSSDPVVSPTPTPDPNLIASNIKNAISIFGVIGTYSGNFSSVMASQALRNPGSPAVSISFLPSTQIRLSDETARNNGLALPSNGVINYRDIPNLDDDNDGLTGLWCQYERRPSVNCGQSPATLDLRIGECSNLNPTTSTWDGSLKCNGGQGLWKLVSRIGANQEVWLDTRTNLLWSSIISTGTNWCQASGNDQDSFVGLLQAYHSSAGALPTGDGKVFGLSGGSASVAETITIAFTNSTTFSVTSSGGASGCNGAFAMTGALTTTAGSSVTWTKANVCSLSLKQGATVFANGDTFVLKSNGANFSCKAGAASGLQPATPVSACVEDITLNPVSGETWVAGGYFAAKGKMGKQSTPAISWRLPTVADYKLADVNGLRFVLPDMGIPNSERMTSDGSTGGGTAFEWTATPYGRATGSNIFGENAWLFGAIEGDVSHQARTANARVRCVGR